MEENKMKKHVTAVAAIRISLHTIGLLAILAGAVALRFAFDFIPVDEIPESILPFVKWIAYFALSVVAAISVLGIIGAIGLLAMKSWARILTMVIAAVSCLNIPVGTLAGVYSIWVLMQDETIVLFRK